MTIGEFKGECRFAASQGLKSVVVRIERHGGQRMNVLKGLLGTVIGSDKVGSFVSIDIKKAEAKASTMDDADEIPKTFAHRAKLMRV